MMLSDLNALSITQLVLGIFAVYLIIYVAMYLYIGQSSINFLVFMIYLFVGYSLIYWSYQKTIGQTQYSAF